MSASKLKVHSVGHHEVDNPKTELSHYITSKAALEGFTKSLAMEVATRGINVNCIAPGMIDSEMIDSLNEKQKENILSRIPMAKLGSPEDIANACLFLGSDMSNYITGQTIHVNGGMAMLWSVYFNGKLNFLIVVKYL